MRSNSEFVAQAIAAIPLWRAFLDKKEAEQDALLAEVLAEKPKPTLLSSLTTRFGRRTAAKGEDEPITEQPVPIPITELGRDQSPNTFSPPIIEEAVTHEDEKMSPFSLDDAPRLRGESQRVVTTPDEVPSFPVEAEKGDDQSERKAVSREGEGKKEVVSSNNKNDSPTKNQDLGDGDHKDEANQFQDLFN